MEASANLLVRLTGTAAVAEDGAPLVLHHGTFASFDEFGDTLDIGFHFGTRRQAENREKEARDFHRPGRDDRWRVVSVALTVRNPLRLHEDPRAWPTPFVASLCGNILTTDERRRVNVACKENIAAARAEFDALRRERSIRREGSRISMRDADRLWMQKWALANARSLAILRGVLEDKGFDGIVYPNEFEKDRRSPSWVAFRPESVIILGEGLPLDRLDVDPAVASAADYAPGANPMFAATDPAARPPGKRRLARRRIEALSKAIHSVTESLGGDQVAGKDAWRIPTTAGLLLVRVNEIGRVIVGLHGMTGDEFKTLFDAVGPIDDLENLEGWRSDWVLHWNAGETPDAVAARLASLVAALPNRTPSSTLAA